MNNLKRLFVKHFPILGKYINVNNGYVPDEESVYDDVMGASNRFNWKVVMPNSDWTEIFKQIAQEVQRDMDCTGHGLSNIVDMLRLAKYNEKHNSSEAYINGMANTSRARGNSMRTVLDSVRTNGIVPEETWQQKHRWKIIPSAVIEQGKAWLKNYDFGYDGVWANRAMMIEALKYSPLYVGGYAWYRKGSLYYSVGQANHCFTLLKDGVAGDSYNPTIKFLDENFGLYYVKRIYLGKKEPEYNKDKIKQFKERGATHIMRVNGKGEIYILNDKLEKVEGNEYLTTKLQEAFKNGTMLPLSEKDYNSLIY